MNYHKLFLILFSFLLLHTTYANDEVSFTTEKFIEQLKNTHPFFKTTLFDNQLSKSQEAIAKSISDWQLNIKSNYQYQDTEHSFNTNYIRKNTLAFNTELSKTDYQTGNRLNVSYNTSKINTNNGVYSNEIALNLIKPLWQNKGGINDKLPIDLAVINTQKTQLENKHNQYEFILKNLYTLIDLAQLQAQLSIHQKRLVLAEKDLIFIKEKFQASVAQHIDVLSVANNVLNIKQQITLIEQGLKALQQQLSVLLLLATPTIKADIDLYQQYHNISPINQALLQTQHHQLLALKQREHNILRQLISNENQALPKLSLNLGLAKRSQATGFANSLAPLDDEITLGLNFNMPLQNLENNAQKTNLELALKHTKQQYQQILLDLIGRAKTKWTQLNAAKAVLESNQLQLKAAKELTQEEEERHKNGLIDARVVINAQNNEQNIRLAYVNNATNYQKYYWEFYALKQQDWLD